MTWWIGRCKKVFFFGGGSEGWRYVGQFRHGLRTELSHPATWTFFAKRRPPTRCEAFSAAKRAREKKHRVFPIETDPGSFLREQFFKRSQKNNYTFPSLDLLGTQKKKMRGSIEITGQKRGKRKKLGSSRFLQRSQIWNLTYLRGQQWADCPSF